MSKSLIYTIFFGLLMPFAVRAQAPDISYPVPPKIFIAKPMTPLKVSNAGGAVPGQLFPQVSLLTPVNSNSLAIQYFVRLPSGDIYGIQYGAIYHIKPDGTYDLFAGGSSYGYMDGQGTAAGFGEMGGITKDGQGNLYVTDNNYRDGLNSRIRKITPGGLVSTYAQGLQGPLGIAAGQGGVLYVAETSGKIMKVATDGTVSLLAGKGSPGADDGTGANASFGYPGGITTDRAGNIFMADQQNNRIRKITPDGVVTTVAGSDKYGSDDGVGTAASFSNPTAVQVDSKGNLLVSDGNSLLRRISAGGVVTTISPNFYDKTGQPVYSNLPGRVIIDENDNVIACAADGFYLLSMLGYNIAPLLPAGLTFGADGTISGTPTALAAPANYKITASNAQGISSATVSLAVVIPPDPPVITSFSPDTAYPGGSITITGNYFTGVTKVTIGGKQEPFYNVTPTAITADINTGTPSGEVTVTTPNGTARRAGFTIFPPPVITSFAPVTAGKGATITITGTGFKGAVQVMIGGQYASFKVISPTQIDAVVGDGASGDIFVYGPGGESTVPGFTFISPPAISSVSPASAGAGATVTINGSNFSNATSVKFGTTAAGSFTVNSATKITAVVAAGSSDGITVSTPGGTATFSSFSFKAPPVITGTSTMKGGNNSVITIYGTNLDGAIVTIGGVPATVTANYTNQIYATLGIGGASGDIVVVTPGGTATLPGFTWIAPPAIASFTPQTAAAGEKISIKGSNLSETSAVSFGGVYATFKVISDGEIEATVPDGAGGAVMVTTPGGSAGVPGFVYKGPSISSFLPVQAGKGQTVTIQGSNFNGATGVSFGGVPATSFRVISATQVSAVVGAGRSGSVTVTTPSGSGSLAGFQHPGPYILSFSPAYAGDLYIMPVTITGNNFTGATAVSFGGVPAASFTVISATSIQATPAKSVSGDVMVTTPLGTDSRPGFTWAPVPAITSISPSSQVSGSMVTITGTGFVGVTSVRFGGVPALYFSVVSPTTLNATVGNGASGDVVVVTAGGTATQSGFTYASPTIQSFSPVLAAAGQTVTINGTNLSGVQSVKFGNAEAASFSIVSSSKITAVTGTGASGNVSVAGPAGSASAPGFTFLPPPVIYAFTPNEGGKGTEITISGANLTGASVVLVGGVAATITGSGDSQVKAKAGSGASGKVSVRTIAGLAELDGFTWYPAPAITSASPMAANAQTPVVVTGTNFAAITQVQLGGSVVNFSIDSSTQITIDPANGASGDITITAAGGTAVLPGFTFLAAPAITSFTSSGEGANATVTLTGSNFTGVTGVQFGGVPAKSFSVVSTTSITARPGAGATGKITVTASGGTAAIRGFLYLKPPSISSFSPASGPVGTSLQINGDNFNSVAAKNIVFFGPVRAQVTNASQTQLTVTVPAGANGLVWVLNTDKKLSANSNLPFIVTNNSGTAGFSNHLDLQFNGTPGRYAVEDFDLDGKPDLLVSKGDSLFILRYGSDPALSRSSFSQKIVLETQRGGASPAIGDVDGDGRMDIMFTSYPSIVLLHNISTADHIAFEQQVFENLNGTFDGMALRDMNSDGRPDLIVGSAETVYYPNTTSGGTISFGPQMYLANASSSSNMALAITDVDGDGKPDPINASSYRGMSIFHNNSVPGDLSADDFPLTYFTNSGTYYDASGIITADFDGDGKPDIVEDNFTGNQLIISRNIAVPGALSASSLDVPVAFSNSSMQYFMNAADMDGDGKIDLVAASNNAVYFARNQSVPGTIALAAPAPLVSNVGSDNLAYITTSDMDGDGRVDILLVDGQNGKLSIYHNGPAVVPEITSVSPLTAGPGIKVTIKGKHFDGTTSVKFGGKAAASFTVVSTESIEAVVGDGQTGRISVLTPNGEATFPGFIFARAPVITAAAAAADGSGLVTISGNYFTGAASVSIGGVAASSFTVKADSTITAVFTGVSGELSVTTPGGTGTLASVTVKANEVIRFPPVPAHTYGDADFGLDATSNNNGIPLAYTLDKPGVVSITGGQLHIITAGTVTVTVSQAGDGLNNAAKSVAQVINIRKRSLTVRAGDLVRPSGQPNPPFSLTYEGFVNGDNESKLGTLPAAGCVATALSPAGSYDIVVSGGTSDSYDFNYIKGILTVSPPQDNFKVAAGSVTCKGENNGSISITAVRASAYTAVLTGNGLSRNLDFSAAGSFDNLAPGTYTVCITDPSLANYQQCFDLVITEPADLSAYAVTDKSANTVTIALHGGAAYRIQLNGKSYATADNTITLPLEAGSNKLTVTTDKLCQGRIEQIINISGNQAPYPNPFENLLYVNIGEVPAQRAAFKIYSASTGALKLEKEYHAQSGVITLDVSGLDMGVYFIHVVVDSRETVYKIIKK
ncbi:IPT/TIG domain-containing protein [Mucilaginibacter ginsenosidivorans]|uniref:T9SS type A sorting domain-containing protein n=1 Tax=Mucilaginibacter ginsenosidivorans TaxID=398053 RepID=A0A5B8UUB3_9SPHI|nr:IPT/TIG domain-containing protein [Mucilaginibacter ginsenosidivorans]QEC62489.1 T9SS type A sorting domain-containing protein [Mucilaginibacter ginsenosidivorans]